MKTDHLDTEGTSEGDAYSKDAFRCEYESCSVALIHKICLCLRSFSHARRRRDLRSDLYVMF